MASLHLQEATIIKYTGDDKVGEYRELALNISPLL
jgi:hypothetical protein